MAGHCISEEYVLLVGLNDTGGASCRARLANSVCVFSLLLYSRANIVAFFFLAWHSLIDAAGKGGVNDSYTVSDFFFFLQYGVSL